MGMPTVTVITPTWQRHDQLLDRCVPSVRRQTATLYDGNFEHVVISDGPDPELAEVLDLDIRYIELPDHRADILYGCAARIAGLEATRSRLVAYLDDDNAWRREHLDRLVSAIHFAGVDFVYSRMMRHPQDDIIGSEPPQYAQIDTSIIVHRRELLDIATWTPSPTRQDPDWELVEKWIAAGATWRHIPIVTCDYYTKGA